MLPLLGLCVDGYSAFRVVGLCTNGERTFAEFRTRVGARCPADGEMTTWDQLLDVAFWTPRDEAVLGDWKL